MKQRVAEFEAFLDLALEITAAPGLALAICNRGELIFSKAVGHKSIGDDAPFLLSTPYPAASTSKAINATLIGMLVDEGLLQWDAPVTLYLPEFELSDPARSDLVTIRDLILMQTGLPRHDWTWNSQPLSRSALLAALRILELNLGFRECQQYSNLGPTVVGHVAERLCNKSWGALVYERLLEPLGMKESFFPSDEPLEALKGHRHDEENRLVIAEWFDADAIGPAGGSLYSTINDMVKWASFNIDPEAAEVRRLISSATLLTIQRPHILAGEGFTDITASAYYGLGWIVDETAGTPTLTHSGYLHDVNNEVSVYPTLGLAVASVSNLGPPRFAKFINNAILKIWQGANAHEALCEIRHALEIYERKALELTRLRAVAAQESTTPAPRDLASYCGVYTHPAYGSIRIDREGNRILARRPKAFECQLTHWSHDRWSMMVGASPYRDQQHPFDATNGVVFEAETTGAVLGFRVQLEPLVGPAFFRKEGAGGQRPIRKARRNAPH